MATYNINDLEPYFNGTKRHHAYSETVQMYSELRVHVNGDKPYLLLYKTRPNEPETIKEYRLSVNEAVTKQDMGKVETSLSKIPRAEGWSFTFEDAPAGVKEDETPCEYFTENFPKGGSLQNWLFNVNFKAYMADPNAFILIMPERPISDTEYAKPYPMVFTSEKVIENHVAKDYYIFGSDERSEYLDDASWAGYNYNAWDNNIFYPLTKKKYSVFYVVDSVNIVKYSKKKDNNGWIEEVTPHGLTYPPVVAMRGKQKEQIGKIVVKESRFTPMVYSLNKAIVLASDTDAARIMHMFPERWEFKAELCRKCNGLGFRSLADATAADGYKNVKCDGDNCDQGYIGGNPFKTTIITPANLNLGQQPSPTPSAGYISKPDVIEMLKLMRDWLSGERYDALAAINMQTLAEVPTVNSGVAKAIDRDEQDNFAYAVADDQKGMAIDISKVITDIRYPTFSDKDRKEMLPKITIPIHYNLLSANALIEDFDRAKRAELAPVILKTLQATIVEQKFQNNEGDRNRLTAIFALDDLSTMTPEQIISAKAAGLITDTDAIIAMYIDGFVERALQENDDAFYEMDYAAQKKIIEGYAQEKIDAMSAANKVMQQVAPPDGNGNIKKLNPPVPAAA